MNKPIVKLSATSIDTFLSCRKKYWYQKVKNIQPVERPDALDFGSAVHKALAYIFNSMKDGDNEKEIVRQYALDQINQYAEEYCLPVEPKCKAIALVDSYMDFYWDDDYLKFVTLDVEKYFEHTIAELPILQEVTIGYFDAVVQNKISGKIYVVEHKTTGIKSDDYMEHSIFDTQVMIYMLACKNKYGRCDGVIYDVLIKPKHVMSVGETDEEFEARKAASKTGRIKRKEAETESDFIKRVQESFSETTFTRQLITHTDEEIEAFRAELDGMFTDIKYCDSYYRCTGNCLKFGACPYMPLCSGKVTLDNLGDKYVNCDKENEEV